MLPSPLRSQPTIYPTIPQVENLCHNGLPVHTARLHTLREYSVHIARGNITDQVKPPCAVAHLCGRRRGGREAERRKLAARRKWNGPSAPGLIEFLFNPP